MLRIYHKIPPSGDEVGRGKCNYENFPHFFYSPHEKFHSIVITWLGNLMCSKKASHRILFFENKDSYKFDICISICFSVLVTSAICIIGSVTIPCGP